MLPADFYLELDELLELPLGTLGGAEELTEIETWDSLAVTGFIALVGEHFKSVVGADQLATAKTTGDLYRLANREMPALASA